MRTISYFRARDELIREFLAGSDMPGPTRAVFRHLLDCAMYAGPAYGWVRHDVCGVGTLATVTGFSEKTVKRALVMLENNGLIKRYVRTKGTGGRLPDEIRIEWDYLYKGAEGVTESPSGQGVTESPSGRAEGVTESPSSISMKKRTTKNPGDAGEVGEIIEFPRRARV